MPIVEPIYGFSSAIVKGAPELSGVYALWQGAEMIYLGRAGSLRQRLLEHLERPEACARVATHYSWELSLRPEERERELLEQFRRRHGRLPRCNGKAA